MPYIQPRITDMPDGPEKERRRKLLAVRGRRYYDKNKEKVKVKAKRWWKENPAKKVEYQTRLRQARRKIVDELKDIPCADCGIKYPPWVMDFDHLDSSTKSFAISRRIFASVQLVQKEASKCEIVCSNCHRERTHNRKDWLDQVQRRRASEEN